MNYTKNSKRVTTPTFSISREWHPFEELLDSNLPFSKDNKKINYGDFPCVFDIESTSFYENQETGETILEPNKKEKGWERKWKKRGAMYAFVFGINGKCCRGRTWTEFLTMLSKCSEFFGLSVERRLVIYVHNLSFEFQWLKDFFEWEKVFCLEKHKVLKAVTKSGIEFRCSYMLTGMNLEHVGKNLQKYPVEKMVGDLDYSLLRNSETPLSEKEWGYIMNDGLVVMAKIQESLEREGHAWRIPLTKTGYPRRDCKKACLYANDGTHRNASRESKHYRNIMSSNLIQSEAEFEQLVRAFHGGFTHANAWIQGDVIEDVTSIDFTSSYPYVIACEKFPMGNSKKVTPKSKSEFNDYLNKYACVFDAEFFDLESVFPYEHFLSYSHTFAKNAELDNGRIVSAEIAMTTMTNVDFETFKEVYRWKRMKVKNLRIYPKGYLPTPLVATMLDYYEKKTTLKGVEGMETEYLESKERVNAFFGMMVMNPIRSDISYSKEEGWTEIETPLKEGLEKYDNSKNRFLAYQWGVFVTAYAQRNLWRGIQEFKGDYLYSDTDSIKGRNIERHREFIDEYDSDAISKLKEAMRYHDLPFSKCSPKDIKGKEHTLGLWDEDAHYRRFKTLGAKRYFVEYDDGHHSFTISGVNKEKGVPYMEKKAKEEGIDVFDLFDEDFVFPSDWTGKNVHTYIDEETKGILVDYLGHACQYAEKSSVHLEKTEYEMSIGQLYREFLDGLKRRKIEKKERK